MHSNCATSGVEGNFYREPRWYSVTQNGLIRGSLERNVFVRNRRTAGWGALRFRRALVEVVAPR